MIKMRPVLGSVVVQGAIGLVLFGFMASGNLPSAAAEEPADTYQSVINIEMGEHVAPTSTEEEVYERLDVFTEVLSTIQKQYVDPITAGEILQAAIDGMIAKLDPFSSYMTPEVYQETKLNLKGEFGGAGMQIERKDNHIAVVAVLPGTPAERAGIQVGDLLLKVDDLELGSSLREAVQKIRGPVGSTVTLTIKRAGQEEPLVIPLVRETIHMENVISEILPDHIGYIRLTQFQETAVNDMKQALSKLRAADIQSLIVDLRNNPGGVLPSAVGITEQFLEPDRLIVSVRNRQGQQQEYKGHGGGEGMGMPMVVLINKGSASASEIFAAAMQDWKRALILGTTTYGKGSVQSTVRLSDGSAVRLTTAKYYTPNGRSIHGGGVHPDHVVIQEVPEDVAKAIAEAPGDKEKKEGDKEKTSDKGHTTSPSFSNKAKRPIEYVPKDKAKDTQLQRAISLLKSGEVTDPVTLPAVPAEGPAGPPPLP